MKLSQIMRVVLRMNTLLLGEHGAQRAWSMFSWHSRCTWHLVDGWNALMSAPM